MKSVIICPMAIVEVQGFTEPAEIGFVLFLKVREDVLILKESPLFAPMWDPLQLVHPFLSNFFEEILVMLCSSKAKDLDEGSVGEITI